MEQEFSDFVEIPRQRSFTKEAREKLKINLCQYQVLFFAISRLHHYANLALKAFAPFYFLKETMIKKMREDIREVPEISADFFSKQEALHNTLFEANANLKKINKEKISLQMNFQEKIQKSLLGIMETDFARLSVVGLIHEQEEIMKIFLFEDDVYKPLGIENFGECFYDINKIKKIETKINKNKQKKGISFIGFNDLLESIDEKYDIKNKKYSFYNKIKECQSFANFVKHNSLKSYDDLSKYPHLFISLDGTVDKHQQEVVLSLNDFYRYIRAFENFWIHICKNVHKPMERNEFIIKSHKPIDLRVQKYQELPWNKEGKIMDCVGG